MNDMTWSEELVTTTAMTFREYYAGMAMQSILWRGGELMPFAAAAAIAVAQADALIAELQREEGDE